MDKHETLIIHTTERVPMAKALDYARSVVMKGRISDGGYCYVVRFKDGTLTYARRNKVSDTIYVDAEEV